MTPKTAPFATPPKTTAAPALFQTVRRSRDLTLVAFGGALLTAFALQAGAFLPRLGSPSAGAPGAPDLARTPGRAAPAVVASDGGRAVAVPCEVPVAVEAPKARL